MFIVAVVVAPLCVCVCMCVVVVVAAAVTVAAVVVVVVVNAPFIFMSNSEKGYHFSVCHVHQCNPVCQTNSEPFGLSARRLGFSSKMS